MTTFLLDYFEYSSIANARAAYITNGVGIDLIPDMTSNTAPSGVASASSILNASFPAWQAMNDSNADSGDCWHSGSASSWWLKYQFASTQIIDKYTITTRFTSNPGVDPVWAPKSWTLQGSNNDSDWTTLDTQTNITDWASSSNTKKTFTFTNTTSYLYYRLNITAGQAANPTYIAVGEFELIQITPNVFSEGTIKNQGTYSVKELYKTSDVNKTLTRTIGSPIDLSGMQVILFDIYTTVRTGSNIKIGIHDSGGTTTEITPNIISTGVWQTIEWKIGAVADANKDVIDSIIITIINADVEDTFYIDNMYAADALSREESETITLSETSQIQARPEKVQESETITFSEEASISYISDNAEILSLSESYETLMQVVPEETLTLSEEYELILYETYDLENDFRMLMPVLSDLNNKINTCIRYLYDCWNEFRMFIAQIYDLNNDIRTKKLVLNDLDNDMRMFLPWQRAASLGPQSKGKQYITVSIGGSDQSDIDVDSISIHKLYNDSATASFILLRAFDETNPILKQIVVIKYDNWVIYRGYIVQIVPGDNPDTIQINCKDKYWYDNLSSVNITIGHPLTNPNTFSANYLTIAQALSGISAGVSVGNFIPERIQLNSGKSEAITQLISSAGNYAWFYENNSPYLVSLGSGGVKNLKIQNFNENLNLYHVLNWNITSSCENIISNLTVYTGGYSWNRLIDKLNSDRGSAMLIRKKLSASCNRAWDESKQHLAFENKEDDGYGWDYHLNTSNSEYRDVFVKYLFDPDDKVWTSRGYVYYDELDTSDFEPYIYLEYPNVSGRTFKESISLRALGATTLPIKAPLPTSGGEFTAESVGYKLASYKLPDYAEAVSAAFAKPYTLVEEGADKGYLFDNFTLDIKYGILTLQVPIYRLALTADLTPDDCWGPNIKVFWQARRHTPEKTGTDTTPYSSDWIPDLPDNLEQSPQEGENNIFDPENEVYTYPGCFKVSSGGDGASRNLYLSEYSVQGSYFNSITNEISQGRNDLPFAVDIATWELSKNRQTKYLATCSITLDAMCIYNINLGSRIRLQGASSQLFNITNIEYNLEDFTVQLTLETFYPYSRSVSIPYHGD